MFFLLWKGITHTATYFLLRAEAALSSEAQIQSVSWGYFPSLPYYLCEDDCPWATLVSQYCFSFCSLPLPVRRTPYCWPTAKHLLYYLVNVMDTSFSAFSLFGAKTWNCRLEGRLIFPNVTLCCKQDLTHRIFISLDQGLHYLRLGNWSFITQKKEGGNGLWKSVN